MAIGTVRRGGNSGNGPRTRPPVDRLAFHFYEARGRLEGHDVEDWLSAERELTHHYR